MDMPYVSSFVYCDNVKSEMVNNVEQTQIMNVLQAITPIAIPTHFTFYISFCLSGITDVNNLLNVTLKMNHEEVIFSTGDFEIQANNQNTLQMNMEFRNLVLLKEGILSTYIQVNNVELAHYDIEVKKYAGDL